MEILKSITISMIILGGFIMVYAIYRATNVYRISPVGSSRRTWKLLIVLMVSFLFGYIFTIVLILREQDKILIQLVGFIFLFGAIFVLLAVHSSFSSLKHLLQTTVAKEEKEVLLKEIHHRVKNNMQVITSLLSLQASFMDDDQAKAMFRYSQYRINSMAMVHEMLYHSEDLGKIDYGKYLRQLTENLIRTMKGPDAKVGLNLDVPEINLNIDTAIPLGLIVNEIITNSLKYGFKGRAEGKISIKILQTGHKTYTLYIGDDGVGFTEDVNFRAADSLGLQLIHKLTLQLKGAVEKIEGEGTNYVISFREITQTS